MKQFKLLNNVVGWLVFLVAAFTYVSTVEPTAIILGLSGVHHYGLSA